MREITGADLKISGMVQGVGYRYYAYRRAVSLGLTGWVRNDRDGAVTASVEGDRASIENLIVELRAGPSGAVVADVVVKWRPADQHFQHFALTH